MKRKLKDKKITLYQERDVSAPGDMPRMALAPIHPGKLWAHIRQMSASERIANLSVQVVEDVLFVINWRDFKTVDTLTLKIQHNEQWYDVTRIDTFEGYKQDLKVYGKLVEAPDPDYIAPYEPTP